MHELLFTIMPMAALVCVLTALWRGGYRGEVTRVVLIAAVVLIGDQAIGLGHGFIPVLLAAGTVAAYAALLIRRPKQAELADEHGYLAEPEPAGDPEPEINGQYDSGGLADFVRAQRERKAS